MQYTPQQEALFAAVAGTRSHIDSEAVAGAGKTMAMVEAAKRCSGSLMACAYNTHIIDELRARMPAAVDVRSFHSLGFAACRRALANVELDQNKAKRHLQAIRPAWFWKGRDDVWRPNDQAKAVLQLAKLVKYTLTDETVCEDLDALVDHYGVEIPGSTDAIYAAVAELIEAAAQDVQTVDFDDQCWLPIRKNWSLGSCDVLFVDERQDLSRLQQALARKAGERLVIVGDTRQAIYGFSGSDCDASARLHGELTAEPAGLTDCPLTVSFRCPRSHVALAQHVVSHIEAAESAADGYVYHIEPDELHREVKPGDMVICRSNAPLIDAAYRLLTARVPALVKGRDVGTGLMDLVKMLKAATPEELGKKLVDYERREDARLERRSASDEQIQSLRDRVESLDTLASQHESIDALLATIRQLFSDDVADRAGKVVLSSVHRAKGLEANRVVILKPEKLGDSHKRSRDWERVQNLNIAYIAMTRSKSELVFAGDVPAFCRNGSPVALSKPLF